MHHTKRWKVETSSYLLPPPPHLCCLVSSLFRRRPPHDPLLSPGDAHRRTQHSLRNLLILAGLPPMPFTGRMWVVGSPWWAMGMTQVWIAVVGPPHIPLCQSLCPCPAATANVHWPDCTTWCTHGYHWREWLRATCSVTVWGRVEIMSNMRSIMNPTTPSSPLAHAKTEPVTNRCWYWCREEKLHRRQKTIPTSLRCPQSMSVG
jgi:hypothetical protein